ncbi:hypothetical protein MP228_012137 [Amoeboaphelidium protococcarum]|nr:hypothetical protein MP228_012137 [Amoeboaphelidium protococcarum]
MPLYELFCISRHQVPAEHTKNLLKKAGLLVLTNGGVVRRFENFGSHQLAYAMRKNHEWFNKGRQWSMLFDANPQVIAKINQEMKLDPVVIRHGIKKLAEKSIKVL